MLLTIAILLSLAAPALFLLIAYGRVESPGWVVAAVLCVIFAIAFTAASILQYHPAT